MAQILLVEDNAAAAALICQYMKALYSDHQITICATATDAFDWAGKHHIDLFILDIQLPDYRGTELGKYIRAMPEYRFTPILFTTELGGEELAAYAVVPLDNFVYVLFLLLAVLLLNSVCFDSREAHIFWGTTMQFALFLLLREVCFVVLGLLDLSVGFWPVYGVRILSLLLWAALWGTGLLRWIREQLKEGDTPLCIIIGNSFLILLLVWWIWQADLLRTNLWFPILATLLALLVLIDGMVLLWDQSRIQFQRRGRLLEQYLPMVEELVESVRARQHEYNNRMMAISAAVMTTGTLDEAKAKITELTGQISLSPSDRELLKCDSKLLCGMLFGKIMQAQMQHIQLRISIGGSFLHRSLSESDWIDLLGILLDNAL